MAFTNTKLANAAAAALVTLIFLFILMFSTLQKINNKYYQFYLNFEISIAQSNLQN
ncbi:hypothetical protein FC93_GL001210 [Lactobacillus kefiranofaciens subsp. kefiranofaciens DSM 5016 = JCM 6985]|nr:hypothetical protein FC93_GL001210 [Lactobacillus kefiranofaciens subsp. kefiranofaciens DSM 5016 = JCM 6985]